MLSAELACRAFHIPNDIQARALPRPAVACRNADFHRRRKAPMSRVYNVIDADGHILEPLDLWDNYMDPKFRDRAPQLVIDNETGKEKLSVEGQLLGSKQGMAASAASARARARSRPPR